MAFPYTYTLTAGQPENINQVTQNFTDVGTCVEGLCGAYRPLLTASVETTVDMVAATYLIKSAGVGASPSSAPGGTPMIYLDDADYTISGRTTKLRLRAQANTNATQPTITFTFGLYPVTFSGGADTLTATLGTVIAGSTVAIASPAASSTTSGAGADFSFPSDGQYVLGVVTSGTLTNNNVTELTAQLQQHWV